MLLEVVPECRLICNVYGMGDTGLKPVHQGRDGFVGFPGYTLKRLQLLPSHVIVDK
jgi:hypothetical protein